MNDMSQIQPSKTPDITLKGEDVDNLIRYLTNPAVFVKVADGTMKGFVEAVPVVNVLGAAIGVAHMALQKAATLAAENERQS